MKRFVSCSTKRNKNAFRLSCGSPCWFESGIIGGQLDVLQGFTKGVEEHRIPGGPQVGQQASGAVDRITIEHDGHDAGILCYMLQQGIIVTVVVQSGFAQIQGGGIGNAVVAVLAPGLEELA